VSRDRSSGAEERVLGIDPGLAITGYGVVALRSDGAVSLVECGVIRTRPGDPVARRLRSVFEGVEEVIRKLRPDAVAVEAVFQGKNVRSALSLGQARGAAILAAALADLPVAEYAPGEVKKAVVGTGSATKEQVAFMVQRQLRLRTPPAPADAADGVAVALCHCMTSRAPGFSREEGSGEGGS